MTFNDIFKSNFLENINQCEHSRYGACSGPCIWTWHVYFFRI